MNKQIVAYWIFTALICLVMAFGGVMDVLGPVEVTDMAAHLGFPVYAFTIIGLFKIAGTVVVLSPGFGRLKEWAYAGFMIDLVGASFAHLSVGDGVDAWLPPLIILGFSMLSWGLRPEHRRI